MSVRNVARRNEGAMITSRLESMSAVGFLRLIKEDDGDICLAIGSSDLNGGIRSVASIEFCTPGSGGGGSSRTYAALVNLAAAMAADNLDPMQSGRRPEGLTDADQHFFVSWTQRMESVRKEIDAANQRERIGGYGWGE